MNWKKPERREWRLKPGATMASNKENAGLRPAASQRQILCEGGAVNQMSSSPEKK